MAPKMTKAQMDAKAQATLKALGGLKRVPSHPVKLEVLYKDGTTKVLPKLHANMTAAWDEMDKVSKLQNVKSVRPVVQTQIAAR